MEWIHSKEHDVVFFNSVLKQYRQCAKNYLYEYQKPDTEVLRQCASDIRPVLYSIPTSLTAFWYSGRLTKNMRMSGLTRIALGLGRLVLAAEVFKHGHSFGAYRRGTSCMQKLVALDTPLGGEISAIIRVKDPEHWLLKYEPRAAEVLEDGSRPRIATEENRLKKIEKDKQQAELQATMRNASSNNNGKAVAASSSSSSVHDSYEMGHTSSVEHTPTRHRDNTAHDADSQNNNSSLGSGDVFAEVLGKEFAALNNSGDIAGVLNEGATREEELRQKRRRRRRRYVSSSATLEE